jgi:putative SOS response-associated peptidase YedK
LKYRIDQRLLEQLIPRFNIAPSQEVLTIRDTENVSNLEMVLWGLIPSWAAEPKGLINARAETLEEKPSFSESFQRRRCLIPADGFYEWRRAGRSRQAFYFQMGDEEPFAFAGIWDRWVSRELESHSRALTEGTIRRNAAVDSCAIITTTANELLAPIHDRMPVILPREDYALWLDPSARPADLKQLLVPFPAEAMKSHPVGSQVNFPSIDNESLVSHVEVEPGTNLSLF